MRSFITTLLLFIACQSIFAQGNWVDVESAIVTANHTQAHPRIGVLENGKPFVVSRFTNGNLRLSIYDGESKIWVHFTDGSTNPSHISVDAVGNSIFVGFRHDASNYTVKRFDFETLTWSTLQSFNVAQLPYVAGNVKMSVGGIDPLRAVVSYGDNNGQIHCMEWDAGSSSFQFFGANSSNITGVSDYVGLHQVYADESNIFILTNVDGDLDIPLRVYRKPHLGTGNFVQPTGSPVESFGAESFSISGNKVSTSNQPNINFIESNVTTFNQIRHRKYQLPNNIGTLAPIYNTPSDVEELVSASDEQVNYVYYKDGFAPTAVVKFEAGQWTQVGSTIGTNNNVHRLDIAMNKISKRPFVGYRASSSSFVVKAFNSLPGLNDADGPVDICASQTQQSIFHLLSFIDLEGDEVLIQNIESSDPAIINVNAISSTSSFDPVSGVTDFTFSATPQPNAVGQVTITLFLTDGYEDFTHDFTVNVFGPNFTIPNNSFCENGSPVNLNTFVTPLGGTFSGPGVTNNFLNPSQLSPDQSYTINYSRFFAMAGCIGHAQANIEIKSAPQIAVNTTSATCNQANGSALAVFTSPSSTSNSHDVYWSFGVSEEDVSSSFVEDLEAGVYFINVTNEFGCTQIIPVTIQDASIELTALVNPVSCHGGNNGQIQLSINSSAAISAIQWSNGATTAIISDLTAGTYEVTVTDENGCTSSASFQVQQPANLGGSVSISNSSCGDSDGSITLTPTGGVQPYSYEWYSTVSGLLPSTSNIQGDLAAGNYFCIVTDNNGCSRVIYANVSDNNSPLIGVIETSSATCENDGSIEIEVVSSSSLQSVSWSNGESGLSLTDLAPGDYTVTATDVNSCSSTLTITIFGVTPDIQPICLVTVDTLTTTNKVVWEKQWNQNIEYYKIYRETSQANVFNLVHTQDFDELTEWTDPIASPMIRSWRYKLSAVDSCGNESEMSDLHKTIHLTMNAGISNQVNLNWDNYEGFDFLTFNVWRHTDFSGWVDITISTSGLPSNQFSFTDPGMLGTPGLDYFIEVVPDFGQCTSTKAQDYNSSRSNKAGGVFEPGGGQPASIMSENLYEFNLYPNPTQHSLQLILLNNVSTLNHYVIYDITGAVVDFGKLSHPETTIDCSHFESGVYIISTGRSQKRFVKM